MHMVPVFVCTNSHILPGLRSVMCHSWKTKSTIWCVSAERWLQNQHSCYVWFMPKLNWWWHSLLRINEGLRVAKRETDEKQVFLYTWLGLYAAAVDASERKQLLLQLQRNANDRFVIVLQLVRYWGS